MLPTERKSWGEESSGVNAAPRMPRWRVSVPFRWVSELEIDVLSEEMMQYVFPHTCQANCDFGEPAAVPHTYTTCFKAENMAVNIYYFSITLNIYDCLSNSIKNTSYLLRVKAKSRMSVLYVAVVWSHLIDIAGDQQTVVWFWFTWCSISAKQ